MSKNVKYLVTIRGVSSFKKAKTFIKNNIKLLIGLIIGIIISAGGVYAAIIIQGSSVGYTDNYSLGATTVQAAIDALYNKTKLGSSTKFVEAYTYNQTSGASNYCVTGNESTCVATTCYKTKSANSCGAGTIIRYKVRPGEVVTFHVMYDDASTITMQTQRNIVNGIYWASNSSTSDGPDAVLTALDYETVEWIYVNFQNYTLGTTKFGSMSNAYTGCIAYNNCSSNTYTKSTSGQARLITVQEAAALGCTGTAKSCPIWMYNYLCSSTSYGATVDSNSNIFCGYYTSSVNTNNTIYVWAIRSNGKLYQYINGYYTSGTCDAGIRPVVVVSK